MSLCLKSLVIHKQSGKPLFQPVSFTVEKGEVLTLMGPSGCGKSTLLSVIAGHLAGDFSYSGEVSLHDQPLDNLPAYQRQVGILFQDDLLFPHLTVWENLAFALPDSVAKTDRYHQAQAALRHVELHAIADSYPDQISGGQRARVSLLRMLLAKPKLALLDEPFSKLDSELRHTFRQWVFARLKEANIPTLMVTHDKEDVPAGSCCLTWPWETSAC